MTQVQFAKYEFKVKMHQGRKSIFDIARKKWVVLTNEEWVRQHIVHYLVKDRNYPLNHIAVERGIELNGLAKRFDVVVFSKTGTPALIVECKEPDEVLNEKVFEQIARYNLVLKVNYLWVTNGDKNYCCSLVKGIKLLARIPDYAEL